MKAPIKRKRGEKHCPINVDSLYLHWSRGDKRIDWKRIEELLDRWESGEQIPWRKLSHTFIKAGPRPYRLVGGQTPNRRRRRRQTAEQPEDDVFDIGEFFEEFRTTGNQR